MTKSILFDTFDAIIGELPRLATMAMQEERAAVVAWLRAHVEIAMDKAAAGTLADFIERGEHRAEVTE